MDAAEWLERLTGIPAPLTRVEVLKVTRSHSFRIDKARAHYAKGMVHSSYFIRGYAIHGYASVPNYPASHGCLRVPIPNAAQIFNWVDIGDPIYLYQ